MYDLFKMEFFSLLADASQEVTNKKMQNTYGEFIKEIRTVSNGNDYSTIYRNLVATRIEIVSFETIPLYRQGKNVLKKLFLQKTLAIINAELELLKFKLTHPELFNSHA